MFARAAAIAAFRPLKDKRGQTVAAPRFFSQNGSELRRSFRLHEGASYQFSGKRASCQATWRDRTLMPVDPKNASSLFQS